MNMMRTCARCRGRWELLDIDCHRAHVQNEAERKRKQKASE